MNPRKASILVIEDDPQHIRLYNKALRGFRVTSVSTASAAVEEIREHLPDLILLDHVLADGERGTAFIPVLKELAAHVPIVVISGTLDISGEVAALSGPLSAHYVLRKPIQLDELEDVVSRALEDCGMGEAVAMLRSLERAERIESNEPERLFTERLSRQHAIINLLRDASERPNVSALARQFRVSRKTIQRDLHDLVARGQLDASQYPEVGNGSDRAVT
jgi:DNA-binding NtrC family response regulator